VCFFSGRSGLPPETRRSSLQRHQRSRLSKIGIDRLHGSRHCERLLVAASRPIVFEPLQFVREMTGSFSRTSNLKDALRSLPPISARTNRFITPAAKTKSSSPASAIKKSMIKDTSIPGVGSRPHPSPDAGLPAVPAPWPEEPAVSLAAIVAAPGLFDVAGALIRWRQIGVGPSALTRATRRSGFSRRPPTGSRRGRPARSPERSGSAAARCA
jgi:hypothetical protein